MAGADPADYAIRLNAWLTGRRANVHPEISTTQVRAVPLDRASAAYTIAESDVASAVARATELEAENARLQRELAAALDGNQRLQTMNEGLRQMAIQAREAADSWQRATIDLYSGREEAAPQVVPELETENARLREELEAARIRLDLLALPVTADGLRALLSVVEQPAAPAPELTKRQTQLLTAIRDEGGDWSPSRAQRALSRAGADVTLSRAAQVMKALAAHELLKPVRPRAQTYRLVAPQQRAQTAEAPQCGSHAHTDFVEDPTIRCELPDGHAWHRNGERTWTP